MAEILNLRQARKRRDRVAKEAGAATNRARFGRTRADRAAGEAEEERSTRKLEAHRRDAGPGAQAEQGLGSAPGRES